MIEITPSIAIDPREIDESFVRSPGPGGQNVNKVATAVQLRFDLRASPSLPEAVRARAERLAGRRLTKDGVLVITAARFRSQERNREDALARLPDPAQADPARRGRQATPPGRQEPARRDQEAAPNQGRRGLTGLMVSRAGLFGYLRGRVQESSGEI
jgi:ribosome-associated protein